MIKNYKTILISIFAITWTLISCVQEEDPVLPQVSYSIAVVDSISHEPIDSVLVIIKDETLQQYKYYTDDDGKVNSDLIESRINQILVSKKGYIPQDTTEHITLPEDSTLTLDFRSLNFSLLSHEDSKTIETNDSLLQIIDSLTQLAK